LIIHVVNSILQAMNKLLFPFSLLVLLMFGLVSLVQADQTPIHANKQQVVVFGGDYNYPPFEYLNAQGEPEGFNVDLVRALAREMGLQIKIELRSWPEVRNRLETGKIDAIIGMFNTPERDKKVDFTIPHFISSYSLFVRDGSDIKEFDDIRNRKVILQLDDLGYDYVKEEGLTDQIITKANWAEILKSLARGEGDCAIVSRIQGVLFINDLKLENIHAVGQPILQQKYCAAVREGNSSLLAVLNEGLSTLKATGEYNVIYEKWFGVYEEKLVSREKLIRYAVLTTTFLVCVLLLVGVWIKMLRRQVRKKTLELQLELKERLITEQRLLENEQQLIAQNEEYETLNEELNERNELIQNINEQLIVAREKAEESNRLKSAFLANMSHEIRTPMNGIIGFSALLARKELSEEKRHQYFTLVNNNAQRLLTLLNDILDISKIETGQIVISKRPVLLHDIFAELKTIFHPQAKDKQIELIFSAPVGEKMELNTDKQRLFQVVANLIGNSLKFTQSGSIIFGFERERNSVLFFVKDTGRGIESEHLVTIFDRFNQGNSSNSNDGTGLGLAIAKSLVEMLGGTIWAKSEMGVGSEFFFTIPLNGN